jgi:hypothetical protein
MAPDQLLEPEDVFDRGRERFDLATPFGRSPADLRARLLFEFRYQSL